MKKTLLIICLIILSSCEKEETIINFLIKTEAFQSNTNCMNGGISIHSGLDLNNNTILEENEITDIEYICNGEDGVDGENGLQVLVIINDEIAGDNCQYGGKRIIVGLDTNENNILEENEISSESFVCNTSSSVLNIVTIGDSLTNPYSDDLQQYLGESYNILSRGIGGEDINEIGFRQGGIQMYFENELILPGDGSVIELGDVVGSSGMISNFNGREINPILQGGAWMINPCYVGNIECTLRWTGSAHNDTNGKFTLKRNITNSSNSIIPVKTFCLPKMAYELRKEVQIIFMGQNGGYDNNEQLLEAFKKCTEYLGHGNFIVITSHKNSSSELNDLMRNEYGHKYINLKTQMDRYGLEYANINSTGTTWAEELLSDSVHFNEIGQSVMAQIVGSRIQQLGY
jgi:hypothetical protein